MLGYVKDDSSGAQGWGVGRHLGGEHDTAVHVAAGEFSPGVQDLPKRVNRGDRRSEQLSAGSYQGPKLSLRLCLFWRPGKISAVRSGEDFTNFIQNERWFHHSGNARFGLR
jgi:hypothetical protein